MYDIIIIGAGTAGLSGAIYAVRAGKSVLVLESDYYGGQIVNAPEIENYPGIKKVSGYDFAIGLYEQAKDLGAKIEIKSVNGIKKENDIFTVSTNKGDFEAKTVILATGARHKRLGLDNEDNLVGKGVSYCAVCDGNFYRGKTVAVVGGVNASVKDVEFLSAICKKVYLIFKTRKFREESKAFQNIKAKENVEVLSDTTVTSLISDNKINSISVENSNGKSIIDIDALFVVVGFAPHNDVFASSVELDSKGYIVAGEDTKTSTEGIFTAGDCRTKRVRQLTTAASDGAVAALAACDYISAMKNKNPIEN